jgi:hypothetical protein
VIVGGYLFLFIVVASAVTLVHAWQQRRAALDMERRLRRLDAYLRAWAELGDWNPALRDALMAIVREDAEVERDDRV